MSFCPVCGRPRATDARFCGGCGSALGDSGAAAAAEPAGPAVPGAAAPAAPGAPADQGAPAGLTRWDAPVGATRLDNSLDAAPPGRYDSWYAQPSSAAADPASPPGAPAGPADARQWLAGDTVTTGPAGPGGYTPTSYQQPPAPPPPALSPAEDTVTTGPARPGGYTPPSYPQPPAPPPPAPSGPQPRPGNRRMAGFVIAVVLVVLAAGGGAYVLAGGHRHTGARPPAGPSVSATPGTTAPAASAPASPVVNASASPTASPSVSVTPSPTRTGTVRAAAGAASDPAAPGVLAYLDRYFSAINSRDYAAYQSLLDAGQQAADPRSAFDSGYATTRDSNEVLTGIEESGGGQLTANVTFTSRQSPASSVDGSACNNWQVSLYLVPRGGGYVKTATPPGYQARYTDC